MMVDRSRLHSSCAVFVETSSIVCCSPLKKRPDANDCACHLKYLPSHIMETSHCWSVTCRNVPGISGFREISHQVASETVWFCEYHGVKTLYFEDLRSFQGKGGMRKHSWNLSTNLWGKMIDGVRYRREALGHREGGVWLVNPAWTSQTCHVCGERGVRVEEETSTTEKKGGEYFYCSMCGEHFHADVNAARNIMDVQQPTMPTAVGGRIA